MKGQEAGALEDTLLCWKIDETCLGGVPAPGSASRELAVTITIAQNSQILYGKTGQPFGFLQPIFASPQTSVERRHSVTLRYLLRWLWRRVQVYRRFKDAADPSETSVTLLPPTVQADVTFTGSEHYHKMNKPSAWQGAHTACWNQY